MSIHLLPKISGDSSVISINFNDNLIRTLSSNPFELFNSLQSISVANNLITELTKDFLKSTFNLKTLILSNNSLSNIDPAILAPLKELHELDLSHNDFTKISADLLEATSSIEILRMENNKLFTIDNAFNRIDYKLRQLFLAENQFTVITGAMFEKFKYLEAIDLSNNKINNIDEKAFSALESLKLLDLSYNNIRRANMRLPNSLHLLTMAHNKLVTWPLANMPEHLEVLEMQHNSLEQVFPKDREVNGLKTLDISYNMIEHLPNTQFVHLDKLDMGYNHLTTIPQSLNSMTPLLHELILDGNRISSVYFNEKTTLSLISLSFMPQLERLGENAFTNLAGIRVRQDGSGTCVDILVSNNENLAEIDETAFEGVNLCSLDLSDNKLEKIPQNLTDWYQIEGGIDLQGNPFSCNCEDQWMLDVILKKLYENQEHQYLLSELKCKSPESFANDTFVHYLNHADPFCGGSGKKLDKIVERGSFGGVSFGTAVDEDKTFKLELSQGPGFIIIIFMCALILILMVLVGVRWQRDQDRKLAMRNRLYGYDY